MNFFLGGGNDMVRGVRYNNKRDGNEVKLDQNEIFVWNIDFVQELGIILFFYLMWRTGSYFDFLGIIGKKVNDTKKVQIR